MSADTAFVEIRDIRKQFGATRALDGVSLDLRRGEVHGLLGENGAGKSTLTKVLAGVLAPDTGTVSIDGARISLGSPTRSRQAGLAMAYQELSAPPNITVAEKLFLPKLPRGPLGLVSRRALASKGQDVLEQFEKSDIDARSPISALNLADRQHVEIIAAMSTAPRLLVLDEPTASLPDTAWLFGQVEKLVESGCSVIYISHKLGEITRICSRGTVLRNGRIVREFDSATADEDELVEFMIGRSLTQAFPGKPRSSEARSPSVTVRGISVTGRLHDISFELGKGEIVGVAGLEGQGQKSLFYALAGFEKYDSGEVVVHDPAKGRPEFSLVPEDRKTEGLFLSLPTQSNLTISELRHFTTFGAISARREKVIALKAADEVNLPRPFLGREVQQLSGGNQQKALFGRAIISSPSCLLLFDPTRGVDAATKVEIYHMTRAFAAQGGSVLIYSTEIPELVGLCDRAYTIYGGRISGEFAGDRLTESGLMSGALGSGKKAKA